MLGIEDKWVSWAYVLCLGSTLLCVLYGLITRNRGEVKPKPEDVEWAAHENEVEEQL